jgi:hypothetical protein
VIRANLSGLLTLTRLMARAYILTGDSSMNTYRLDMKIGEHEFHGAGAQEAVERDFREWKALIASHAHTPARQSHSLWSKAAPGDPADELFDLFVRDENAGLVSLKALPRGEDRDRDALLLILYGFKTLLGEDLVRVTQLKRALKQTGCSVDRIDRVAAKYIEAGYVNKSGMNKGGRYSLTNRGVEYATSVASGLLQGEQARV